MKIKRIVGIAAILAAFLFIFDSCTKNFEDINTDPNNAGLDKAAPDMLLTNVIEMTTDRVQEIFLGEEMGNCWVQHEAKVQYTDEDRYIYRTSVVNATWSNFYAGPGMCVTTLYNTAVARQHDNYKGVALVLKVYITSVITDLHGPVPYFNAWTGALNTLPPYDSQESIYRDIIAKLDTANTLLTIDGDAIAGDILFNNDITKWKKFANSLRLRLLLRMSGRDEAFATTEMSKIVNDPATYPIFESNEDNAALQYLGSFPNNHPLNENRKTRDDHRVSKTITDMMWALSPKADWRIAIYADLDDNDTWEGMPNGLTSSQAASYNGNGIKYTSKLGNYFTAMAAGTPMPPGMLMSYAELQFILAEAAFKNYISGDAETFYYAGIYGSYAQFGDALVAAVDNAGYLASPEWTSDSLAADFIANDIYGWDAGNGMQLIATQRWAATFDQGLQAWFEWRRTGYPVLTPAAEGMNDGKIPVRVPYPTDEAARNPSSLAEGVTLLGGPDDLNTRVWWDLD
ncbi:MAG: SusD/RagB family nutrient-binding outer membrane lipoprotein [Bacteroidales bacterium]|nr:SusD/RagB family nutrient-binding outer membrane lipoprotein [Bacteroidales bacterium]